MKKVSVTKNGGVFRGLTLSFDGNTLWCCSCGDSRLWKYDVSENLNDNSLKQVIEIGKPSKCRRLLLTNAESSIFVFSGDGWLQEYDTVTGKLIKDHGEVADFYIYGACIKDNDLFIGGSGFVHLG